MTIGEFQKQSAKKLQEAGIGTSNLDILILLEDELGKDRAWILAHPEYIFKGRILKELEVKLRRREKHEPLAYIRGKIEFYGRDFYVDKRVLVPRPESETMITLIKTLLHHKMPLCKDRPCKVMDVGTGSGALAITTKLEMPNLDVLAIDIDLNCLKVAKKNAKKHKARVDFLAGDLLNPLSTNYHLPTTIILANLPYVPDHFHVNEAAALEPHQAIFGGSDGLDVYRKLFGQLARLKQPPGYVLTESLPPQHKKLTTIAKKSGYELEANEDFIGVFRYH